MSVIVVPFLTTAIVVIILYFINRKKGRVDKGFAINYFKLSYRRRMIRNLYTLPLTAVAVGVIFMYTSWSITVNILFATVVFLLIVAEIIYNYRKWQTSKQYTN
ncbi:hypothetical protein ACLIBH_10875 [Virgibacillus sp. W0430]|uniref:hypothetical protein n=1 Tax=Virgibacillus sp. W0430 TaxID=3391580 RepID=UPI003F456AD4